MVINHEIINIPKYDKNLTFLEFLDVGTATHDGMYYLASIHLMSLPRFAMLPIAHAQIGRHLGQCKTTTPL